MNNIGKELKVSARKNYLAELALIDRKVKGYDDMKKIGELWIQRGYYRTYTIDRISPYYLSLKTGPQEELLCPIINPFIEELEDLGYDLGEAEIEGNIVKINVDEYKYTKTGVMHFIPARPDRCIRVEETEVVEKKKVIKSSMIC